MHPDFHPLMCGSPRIGSLSGGLFECGCHESCESQDELQEPDLPNMLRRIGEQHRKYQPPPNPKMDYSEKIQKIHCSVLSPGAVRLSARLFCHFWYFGFPTPSIISDRLRFILETTRKLKSICGKASMMACSLAYTRSRIVGSRLLVTVITRSSLRSTSSTNTDSTSGTSESSSPMKASGA